MFLQYYKHIINQTVCGPALRTSLILFIKINSYIIKNDTTYNIILTVSLCNVNTSLIIYTIVSDHIINYIIL